MKFFAGLLGCLIAASSLHAQAALAWTKRTPGLSPDYTLTSVGSIGGAIAVVGHRPLPGGTFENRISTSTDGITWSAATVIPTAGIVRDVVSGIGISLAAVEDSNVANINRLLSSSDGATWTPINTGAGSLVSIARNNLGGPIVAVGSANGGNNVFRSPDGGVTWSRINTGRNIDLHKVVFGNNRFLAVSRSGTLLSSPTGATWSEVIVPGLPAGATFPSITSFDGRFLLLVNDSSQRPGVFVSADGATWAASGSTIDSALFNGVIATNGSFVSIAGGAASPGPGVVYTAGLAVTLSLAPGTAPVLGPWPASAQVVDPVGPGLNFLSFVGGLWVTGGANGALYTAGATGPGGAPTITAQPAAVTAVLGGSATFSVTAVGSGSGLTYQWFFNSLSSPIPGATGATYAIPSVTAAHVGNYFTQISYPGGVLFSASAALTLDPRGPVPVITAHPVSQSAAAGSPVVFSVTATSQTSATYQWLFNGGEIFGGTGSTFTIPSVAAFHAGTYSARVTNAAGSVTSNVVTLTVTAPAVTSFLSNLSVRARAGSGSETLIVGVTVGGDPAGAPKSVLIRGVGPTLGSFGVADVLADPVISISRISDSAGATTIATIDDWDSTGGIAAASAVLGAFALPADSRDAAFLGGGFGAGSYTVQIFGKSAGSGNALVELYDTAAPASITATSARFTNVSARTFGGTGSDTLIVGFNVAGTGTRRLVIRAIGPGLAGFGVIGTMPDPKVELYDSQAKIGENDNWDGATSAAQLSVGAFALTAGSRDAVLVSNLSPGSYTVQVTGGTTGVVLVEAYEAP